MKKLFQKISFIIAIAISLATAVLLPQTAVYADGFNGRTDAAACGGFLGLKSWDCGVVISNQDNLGDGIWQIATNVSEDIAVIATYLIVGYVIYGGYLYIFSAGDPTKAAAGKKTITRAFIGLAVTVFAKIILSSISMALIHNSGGFDNTDCISDTCVTAGNLVTNVINWVIGIAGVVAAVYVVIGGIGYITSAGDPGKLQKAKTTIVYSLIGLAIVGLSLIISNYGYNIIEAANTGKDISEPILNLLNSVIAFLSVISVIFIIKGGVGYMTSTGDPGKIKSAKDTILYACIGLIVCALAFIIVNWAVGIINGSTAKQPSEKNSITKPLTIYKV